MPNDPNQTGDTNEDPKPKGENEGGAPPSPADFDKSAEAFVNAMMSAMEKNNTPKDGDDESEDDGDNDPKPKGDDKKNLLQEVMEIGQLRDIATSLETERDTYKSQNDVYLEAIKARNEVDFSSLSEKQREILQDFAGEDPIQQSIYFTKMHKHGLFGTAPKPNVDRSRLSGTGEPDTRKTTLEDARKGVNKKLAELRGF